MRRVLPALVLLLLMTPSGGETAPVQPALFVTVDLDRGESRELKLTDGTPIHLKLVSVESQRDPLCGAVRGSRVTVEVNGQHVELTSATYHLPREAGAVQLDCPITADYLENSRYPAWGLQKNARLRLWPAGSPWIQPGTFYYPVRQRWFASHTQMANEPVYVDGGDVPGRRPVYYHSGLDIGGAEGMVEVVAATDGRVVSAGETRLDGFEDSPVEPRYDVVYVQDARGWFYRYSHLKSIDPAIRPGASVQARQKIGLLGKEGGSGGWSHLHFEIISRQPSGQWGTQEGYAFLWQAYIDQYQPKVLAVARPHHLARTGDPVLLDASRSWSHTANPLRCEWIFSDGSTAVGTTARRVYERPGSYSEILKVSDDDGHIDYDFATVQVIDPDVPDRLPPTIHAAFSPARDLQAGTAVTFKVRTFRTTVGEESWDFGDGTPRVTVRSDGNLEPLSPDGYASTEHVFEKPGNYLASVSRTGEYGYSATARLYVVVGAPEP